MKNALPRSPLPASQAATDVGTLLSLLDASDDLADAVVDLMDAEKRSLALGQPFLPWLMQQREPACERFLQDVLTLPTWADQELMQLGGRMAGRHAPHFALAITYGALPLAFSHPSSAVVFKLSGDMARSVSARLRQSAELFFGVVRPRALLPFEPAWRECLRVRLVHARVRRHLLRHPQWNRSTHGVPINLLQLAAGPAFFGSHVLRAMTTLGARASAEEREGYAMIFRLVTKLLGGPEKLIGTTGSEQERINDALLTLSMVPDDLGRELVAALLRGLSTAPQTGSLSPLGQAGLMRTCLGTDWADALCVPEARPADVRILEAALRVYARIANQPALRDAAERLGAGWLNRMQPCVDP